MFRPFSKFSDSVKSAKSTIRGRMMKKLSNLFDSLMDKEDRILVYLKSLRGIRISFEDCNAVHSDDSKRVLDI